MPKNKLDDLRNHLFETLERLKDEEKPMELDRARAIADVATVIVNSAKVEVNAMNAMGAIRGSGFFPQDDDTPRPAALKAAK
jgi:hypothetical protein